MTQTATWPEDPNVLHLARRTNRCTVLGPGVRAVLWLQGCPFRCPGCVAPETLPFEGGTIERVEDLAAELSALPEIEGVTFSGGEPMAQATGLSALIDAVRRRRPGVTFISYTGYTVEHLRRSGTAAQKGLLGKLDILIDGPYLQAQHTDLRWRGSSNQRVLFLSARYRELAPWADHRGRWMEFECGADGSLHWMGIPPQGFREAFEEEMARRGIELKQAEGA